jgi:hypothetical protein
MFVRWKHRQLRRDQDVTHYAQLVENTRFQGRTRQRVICSLAHIRERFRSAPAHRDWFWRRVDQRLDALALDPQTRQALEARLAETVPRPSAAELAQVRAQRTVLGSD